MPIVSEICMQVKNKQRANLYLDGKFYCGLQTITVLSNNIVVGMEIDYDSLSQICIDSEVDVGFNKAIRYMGFRMHSQREVEEYLGQKGFLTVVVDIVIQKLLDYKYIDDMAFARAYVDSYKSKNGTKKLEYELGLKGVASHIIADVLAKVDSSSDIDLLIAKRYAGDRHKIISYLTRRGFEYDTVCLRVDKYIMDVSK